MFHAILALFALIGSAFAAPTPVHPAPTTVAQWRACLSHGRTYWHDGHVVTFKQSGTLRAGCSGLF